MTPDTPAALAAPAGAATSPADTPQPQTGGSYIRCPETGALTLATATQPAGADSLRHQAAATDTPAQEP